MRRKPVFPFFVILILGTAVISLVRADYNTEEITTRNTVIDCSTSPRYNNRYIASAFKAGGGHVGMQGKQCNACHKSSSPRIGTGDKPVTRVATALIHNRLSTAVSYEVKVGKGKWTSYLLSAGGVRRHSWNYKNPGQNASPEFLIRYEHPTKGKHDVPLNLMASPTARLGSVYFFERDTSTGKPKLWVPFRQANRGEN